MSRPAEIEAVSTFSNVIFFLVGGLCGKSGFLFNGSVCSASMGGPVLTSRLILYMPRLLIISNYNPTCEMEDENLFDPYAVAITEKGSNVIGHNIPRKISAACSLFLEDEWPSKLSTSIIQFSFV